VKPDQLAVVDVDTDGPMIDEKAAAEILRGYGLRMGDRRLQTLRSIGGGPAFVKLANGQVLYTTRHTHEYARGMVSRRLQRLTQPRVRQPNHVSA
jgi:hypothetical protein